MSLSFALNRSQVVSLGRLVQEKLEHASTTVAAGDSGGHAHEEPLTLTVGHKEDCDIRVKNDETVSKLFGLISRRHCRLEVRATSLRIVDGVKAGVPSKNGTFVGKVQVDDEYGMDLKEGDVVGLGVPVDGTEVKNPYCLVVEGVEAFLAWAGHRIAEASLRNQTNSSKGAAQGVVIKHEEAQTMDVDFGATGNARISNASEVVDLTFDSDSDGQAAEGTQTRGSAKTSEIIFTESPPAWFDSTFEYQLYDRKLVPLSSIRMTGQLRDEQVKLVKVPHEFLLDVNTQPMVDQLLVKNRIDSAKKMWLGGSSEAQSRNIIRSFTTWMKSVYLKKLNEDMLTLLDTLDDDEWDGMTCAAARDSSQQHFAIPNIKGLMGYGNGAMCGACALHHLKARVPLVVANAAAMERNYQADSNIWQLLKKTGLAKKMELVNLTQYAFELLYNRLVHEANAARRESMPQMTLQRAKREKVGAKQAKATQAGATQAGTTQAGTTQAGTTQAGRMHEGGYGRAAKMVNHELVFAVERISEGRACGTCGKGITAEHLAFGALSKDKQDMWSHLSCVSVQVRNRALTEGIRGWAGMGVSQRREVIKSLLQ